MKSPRQQQSGDSLLRCFSVSLAVVTSLMLVPASWIPLQSVKEEPPEPKPRPIEIVRVPPETLPPPPPLPPRPKPRPEPEPEKVVQREPEPEPEPVKPLFEPEVPEIEVPREKRVERRDEIRAQDMLNVRLNEVTPDVDVPREQRQTQQPKIKVADQRTLRVARTLEPTTVAVPKAVPRDNRVTDVAVASITKQSYHDAEAPDVEVATPRAATRSAATASPLPPSQQLRTGVTLSKTTNAPAVDLPSGNTSKPQRAAPVAVSGAFTGSRVTYDKNPGNAGEVAIPTPRASNANGAAPAIAVAAGGTEGLKYSAAPSDAPTGKAGQARGTAGPERLEQVRSALARRYGLPLVSVNDLGQRSTEAARWNVLLPQLTELLRQARDRAAWSGSKDDEVIRVERDGDGLVIRYRDGVVHVIVPAENGLAMLFVARGQGARPVTSKVEEAESAKRALHRYTRGAS